MSALSIQPTFPIFTETDGLPLENGYIWIGTANLDPQGNPINVYWDAALTIAAPQPIRTINGYPGYQGTPARLYVNSDYSIRVQNSKGSLVYSAPAATERYSSVVLSSINALQVIFDPAGTGAVQTNGQVKWREYVTFQDFGAVGDGVADDTVAVQNAITYASTNRLTIFAYGGFKIASTINFPSNTNGCTIQGQSKQTYFKFTGTGALFASLSTNSIVMRNFTMVGPGSSFARTALFLQTSNPSAGVYYCVFEDLTIEGFMYGISMAGLCEAVFRKINIGLNKSGIFTGTPQQGSPLIGISIGTTVLAAQFEGLTIFATKRCVSQTTEQQIVEGHYWFGCTFDLSFNDGTATDQNCVAYESGQDIVFTSCWFTNTQKYGTASSFFDKLLWLNYDGGATNVPMVSFKFTGCTFAGNDITCNFNTPSPTTSVAEFAFTGCVFRLWANFSEFVVDGNGTNFNLTGNTFRFYGDPITVGGVDKYDLPVPIVSLYDIEGYAVTGNSFHGVLPIHEAPCYMRVNGTSSGKFQGNLFPQTDILTTGDDVAVVGTNTNVTILESQQLGRRLLNTVISNGTYNLANPTIASINTICTKPQVAIVQLYIDTSTITNPGAGDMIIECVGLGPFAGNKYQVNGTGTNGVNATFVGTVLGTVSFNIITNFQIVTTTAASQRSFMSITFI